MKIIADSSSTRTEWALVDGDQVVKRAFTEGLNPYFHTRREISHIIRLTLPDEFFQRRWKHVYFYGAGCANEAKCKQVEASLVAQFKTPVTVESDLLGAARGLLVRRSGLACILGSGSNACYYDGNKIVKSIHPLGFILGDEGSNSHLGKLLVSDILKEVAPQHIIENFSRTYGHSVDEIMDNIYSSPRPTMKLTEYSHFLRENLNDPYVEQMVYEAFTQFFKRNLIHFNYATTRVSFVGSTAVDYQNILHRAAADFGLTVEKILPRSMPGLIKYHNEQPINIYTAETSRSSK